ncbi:MAG: hypothetical protein SCH98_06900 [Deferrisomatales bacterium]|nr:hypothetical protein [Deferrisomatales bacterium]
MIAYIWMLTLHGKAAVVEEKARQAWLLNDEFNLDEPERTPSRAARQLYIGVEPAA